MSLTHLNKRAFQYWWLFIVFFLAAFFPAALTGQMLFTESIQQPGKILYAGGADTDTAFLEFPGKSITAMAQGYDGVIYILFTNERSIYRLLDKEPVLVYTHSSLIKDIAFDSGGRLYFSQTGPGISDGKIYGLDDGVATEYLTAPYFSLSGSWSGSFAFRPSDGKVYISVNGASAARIYRMSGSTPQQIYMNASLSIQKLEFNESGSVVYFTGASKQIQGLAMTTQKLFTVRENSGRCYGDVLILKQFIRFGPDAGRVNQIVLHPTDPQIVYAGTSSGGVFRSHDGGGAWYWRSTGLKHPMIGGLMIYPQNPAILIAATPAGVFRSTDEGRAWTQRVFISPSFPPANLPVRIPEMQKSPVRYDPGDDAIYAAPFASGVFKSVNQGQTWTQVYGADIPSALDRCVFDIEVTAENGGTVYLAAINGLLRNTGGDGPNAADWPNIAPEITGSAPNFRISPTCVRIAPSRPGRMYVASACLDGSYIFQQVWRRDNTTSPFQSSLGQGQGWVNQEVPWCLEISPLNSNILFLGFVDGWQSIDAGKSWANLRQVSNCSDSNILGVDYRGFAISADGASLWAGHDQGIFRYTIGSTQIEAREKALSNIQFYDMDMGAMGTIYAGTQDRGFFIQKRNESWLQAYTASDMCITVADDVSDHILFFRRPTDSVETFNAITGQTSISNFFADCGSSNGNLALVRGANVIYTGSGDGVYRSDNKGKNFYKANGGIEGQRVRCVMTIPGNVNVVFAGMAAGGLYRTVNGGQSWQEHYFPVTAPILSMTLAPNGQDWYVGATDGLYYSSNTGKTWQARNSELPNRRVVSAITVDTSNPSIVYTGLGFFDGAHLYGGGVYWSSNKGVSWSPLGSETNQFLNVTSIRQDPVDPARIWIATYGSGMMMTLRPEL